MPKLLSAEAIAQYQRDGYYAPIPAMSPDQVRDARPTCSSSGCPASPARRGGPAGDLYKDTDWQEHRT